MNKVWNHTKTIRCSRCLAKIKKQEDCRCEKCNKEAFNLPFDFFKDKQLLHIKRLYESWLNTRLERTLARKEYDKKYRKTHKEEIAKQGKKYYETHKEEIAKKHKKYRVKKLLGTPK